MKDICETLFEPLRTGAVSWKDGRILFLNAFDHPFLRNFSSERVVLQQCFKPQEMPLIKNGWPVLPEIPQEEAFALVLHLFPKNVVEGRYQMASALRVLQKGGILVCAAANDAGAGRLKKLFSAFGLSDIQDISKNKARVVWGVFQHPNEEAITEALSEGRPQEILGGQYISQPGIFGWDKIDKGSQILARLLPPDLQGQMADFGCGYSFLARQVLERFENVKNITCVDADYRAIEIARKNLSSYQGKISFEWADLSQSYHKLKNLDFIVMNPPFHNGKKTDISLGTAFIKNAYEALRRGGRLLMVANVHLPYEPILSDIFSEPQKIFEGEGFKVFFCRK